jgi:hypothetical protein
MSGQHYSVIRGQGLNLKSWVVGRGCPCEPRLDCLSRCAEIYAPGLRRRVLTTGLPSGTKQPVEPLSHLLVGEIFAALQGCFAKLDGFNKAGFLGEIAADSLLRKRIRVTASMAGQFCKLALLLRREMYFHKRQCKSATSTCQRAENSCPEVWYQAILSGVAMASVGAALQRSIHSDTMKCLEYIASVVRFRCVAVPSGRPKSKGQNPGAPW